MVSPEPKARAQVVVHSLDDDDYLGLLAEYLQWRLGLSEQSPATAAIVQNIIDAADRRFAQVSFLADRRKNARVSDEELHELAQAARARRAIGPDGQPQPDVSDEGAGSAFYQQWLHDLDYEYGRKLAESVRQVLAMLAAAEQAHEWVFTVGRKQDPTTGGALSPLSERFDGLDIERLAQLLDLDRPSTEPTDRIDPALLFTLQSLQGVLMVSRADSGASRFRLALKEFLPTARVDPVLGPMMKQMHGRLATKALNAWENIKEEGLPGKGRDWPLFNDLAPTLEASIALSESDSLTQRWDPDGLSRWVEQVNVAWREGGDDAKRIDWLTLACAWLAPSRDGALNDGSSERVNRQAGFFMERGNARWKLLDLLKAIADYGQAITLRQGLREALSEQGLAWPPQYQNDLAAAFMNRANSKQQALGPGESIADYDQAITLRQALREALTEQGLPWPPEYQNDLAGALMNRAVAKRHAIGPGEAIADYDQAITLRQGLREALTEQGLAWTPEYQNDLATAFMNRANSKQQALGPGEAIADYDQAITLRQALREALAEQGLPWTPQYQNDLANAFMNRAVAKAQAIGPGEAIADFDQAITLRQALREALANQGLAWTPQYQNDLAAAFMNRAVAKQQAIGPGEAIADYDQAVTLRQGLREALTEQGLAWPPEYQNDLANAFMNRAVAKRQAIGPGEAIADYDQAIALRQALREALTEQGLAWPPQYQNDLANAFVNRAVAKRQAIGPGEAIADYDQAIALRQALREALTEQGLAWPPQYQNDLAGAFVNRAVAKRQAIGPGEAIADYDQAITLRQALREALTEQGLAWPPDYYDDLALAYIGRGQAQSELTNKQDAVSDFRAAESLLNLLRQTVGESTWSQAPHWQQRFHEVTKLLVSIRASE